MNKKTLAACLCNLLLACAAVTSQAHEQHNHAQEEKTTTTIPALSSAAPRLVLESPQFELVGTLEGNGLRLYLDDYASNAPVTQAQIELEIAGQRIIATANADGSYDAALLQPLADGEYAVMATLLAGETSDLLAGELVIHTPTAAPVVIPPHDHDYLYEGNFLLGLSGLIMAAILAFTWRRDRHQRRQA